MATIWAPLHFPPVTPMFMVVITCGTNDSLKGAKFVVFIVKYQFYRCKTINSFLLCVHLLSFMKKIYKDVEQDGMHREHTDGVMFDVQVKYVSHWALYTKIGQVQPWRIVSTTNSLLIPPAIGIVVDMYMISIFLLW